MFKTVTGLTDRLPAVAPDLPEHSDYPRILAAFNQTTGPLRAKDVCETLGHELLPKNVEGTRAKLKRLVRLGILTADRQLRQEAIADGTPTSDLAPTLAGNGHHPTSRPLRGRANWRGAPRRRRSC